MQGTLLATGFPFRNPEQVDEFMKLLKVLYTSAGDIRRAGSAALDLAYVAAGRLDGFWESSLKPWDLAAGALLVREAGGLATDYAGESDFLENGQIVAANPRITAEMLRIIQKTL